MQNAAFRTICPIEHFTPANSILVTLFLLVNFLARTYFRFRTQVTHKLLEYLPILLSVWTVAKVYAGVNWPGFKALGVLFPALFVFADTICGIPSVTRVVSGLLDPLRFAETWRRKYLVSTQVLLCLTTGLGSVGAL